MADLSIVIPARNEMFLRHTVEDALHNLRGNTELIVIADGAPPVEPLREDPRLRVIQLTDSIGQRAATNLGVRESTAKYVMKVDAHCAFDEGFDVKLMARCEPDWTVIPRMYNLHVFDWQCIPCGHQTYQGPTPKECPECKGKGPFQRVLVWKPRWHRCTDFARFDSTLHFQYWGAYKERPEAKGDFADVMSFIGACFFMERARYHAIDGLDEAHGSWGQMGTEIACKSWLSGGRLVVNKMTWFSHMFRTQPGFSFPYHLSEGQVERAREHSRHLWLDGAWPKAKYPLTWLLQKFAPVPGWPEDAAPGMVIAKKKAAVYYSDSRGDERILLAARQKIQEGLRVGDLIAVTLKPLAWGQNIVLPLERGHLTMFRQILAGLEATDADLVYFTEHDVLYHPSHFDFVPPRADTFYYNQNVWKVDAKTGQALFYRCNQTSGLVAYRELLLQHYRTRVARVEAQGFTRGMGFEPGTRHVRHGGVDDVPHAVFNSEVPNIDIRHGMNLTESRWRQDQFRNKKYCEGWTLADEVPGWGRTKGRFDEFLQEFQP